MRQARSNFDRKRRSEPSSSFIIISPPLPCGSKSEGGLAPLANVKSRIGGRALPI